MQQDQQEKQGFFHMLGKLWGTVTRIINTVDEVVQAAELHANHLRLTTEAELSSELATLQAKLSAPTE